MRGSNGELHEAHFAIRLYGHYKSEGGSNIGNIIRPGETAGPARPTFSDWLVKV